IVLLLSDDERNYGHSKTYEFRTIDYTGKDRFPRWVPLIIPPMNIKIRSHPLFFFQDRRFRERLQDAERVVIIGWSMPPTDLSYSSFIERQVELRLKQLNELIIIDPCGEVNKLFNKFEALFRPRRLKPINKGFGLESIRECLN
ncbi:hypothetical protein KAR91_22550, partial [Candidatus Pacearchaeota archaeon]|nr:hypothetical protein [Candidatus Pacearchaeota archaeon]